MQIKKGYTIVEAVVALVIIGVVIAVVVFKLFVNGGDEFDLKYNKVAAMIESNIKNYKLQHTGLSDNDFALNNNRYREAVKTNMVFKITNCTVNSACWSNVTQFNGDTITNDWDINQLNDDVTIAIANNSTTIYIDVNGSKGPNIQGRDIRRFAMNTDLLAGHPENVNNGLFIVTNFHINTADFAQCLGPNDVSRCTNCFHCYTKDGVHTVYYDDQSRELAQYFYEKQRTYYDYENGEATICWGAYVGLSLDDCATHETNHLVKAKLIKQKDGSYNMYKVECSISDGCSCTAYKNWTHGLVANISQSYNQIECGEYGAVDICTWEEINGQKTPVCK